MWWCLPSLAVGLLFLGLRNNVSVGSTGLIFGTRGSDLALAQTRDVITRTRLAHPDLDVSERIIKTTGDVRLDVALRDVGTLDKGLFTKELEDALLRDEIDAAVHSLKDLPTQMPDGLEIAAILARESWRDCLVSRHGGGLAGLPGGATVATGSPRRAAFLGWLRPDLRMVEIRGNVPTRIGKLHAVGAPDAIVLAEAGIRRLRAAGVLLELGGLEISALDEFLPAPGQGAVAVQARAGDLRVREILGALHDADCARCVSVERMILERLGGGCHCPHGILAEMDGGQIGLRVAKFDDGVAVPRMAGATAGVADWERAVDAVMNELI